MRLYLCLVHTPRVMTPYIQIMPASTENLMGAIEAAIREWPSFELIEVFENRRPILRFLPPSDHVRPQSTSHHRFWN
jgi:hypothetical protein